MKIRYLISLVSLLFVMNIPAFGVQYDLISEIGTSAQMIGVGNVSGFGQGAAVLFENPASLTNSEDTSLSLFTTKILDEVNYISLAISTETDFGKIGFGYLESAVFDIPHTDLNGSNRVFVDSYFDYKDTIYKFTYQADVNDRVSLGTNVSYYSKGFYGYSGTGYNMDLGALVRFEKFDFSVVGINVIPGTKVTYTEGSEELPFQMIAGVNYRISDFSIMSQAKYFHDKTLLSHGLVYKPRYIRVLTLSGGYKQYLSVGDLIKQNVTIGLGLDLSGVQFYYAFEKSEHYEFDNKNYFSLVVNF